MGGTVVNVVELRWYRHRMGWQGELRPTQLRSATSTWWQFRSDRAKSLINRAPSKAGLKTVSADSAVDV